MALNIGQFLKNEKNHKMKVGDFSTLWDMSKWSNECMAKKKEMLKIMAMDKHIKPNDQVTKSVSKCMILISIR